MAKGNIILLLNERLKEEERFFKLSCCDIKGECGAEHVYLTLLVPAEKYDQYLDEKNGEAYLRTKVQLELAKLLPDGMTLHVVFKKSVTTDTQIVYSIMDFLKRENRILTPKILPQDIGIKIVKEEYIEIKIDVSRPVYDFCQTNNVGDRLKDYLDTLFLEDCEISYNITKEEKNLPLSVLQTPPARLFDYELTEPIYGTPTRRAKYISDVIEINAEIDVVALTGVVIGLREFPRKNVEDLFYYLFRIDDKTATIEVKCFPRALAQCNAMRLLENGDTVVIEGSIRRDDRSNKMVLWVKSISKARVDYDKALREMKYLTCPEHYATIEPMAYSEPKTAVNMTMFEGQECGDTPDYIPEKLLGKTYVVFDTETTGLNKNNDDVIIELSAAKMVDGVITETWQTFVNPFTSARTNLSKEIVKLTGITDDMLRDAPTFNRVVGDFYKFCFGATLVAHNAAFDMSMLLAPARKLGYNFDNPVVDTLEMSREIFPKLPKHTLSYLCEQLDIKFEGDAHRAIYDAIACAKLFRKLSIKDM